MFYGISTHLGGAERSLLEFLLLYNRDKNRSDFFVLLPKGTGPFVDALEQNKIAYKVLEMPHWVLKLTRKKTFGGISPEMIDSAPLHYLRDLAKTIKENGVDTVHCTGIKCHIAACLISAFTSARIIVHLRDMIPVPLSVFFATFKPLKKVQFIAASKAIAKSARFLKPQVVYDGLDDLYFKPQRTTFLKDHFQIPESSPLLGLVGVIARWKGQKEFMYAAKEVLSKHPTCHFVIVGDQIYDTAGDPDLLLELKNLRRDLNLQSNFHFLGFQKNMAPIYNSLDWLVHASINPEPFGRVLVEAMLCKTPVIAANAGGVLEIIEDTKTGLLHDPKNVHSLAQTMDTALLMKEADRINLVDEAYGFCKRMYILGERYDELKQIIEKN